MVFLDQFPFFVLFIRLIPTQTFVTDQTKMRRPPTNSLPIALRLYAIVRVVLLLVKLRLQKAVYPYCIVTFTLPVYTDIVLLHDFNS